MPATKTKVLTRNGRHTGYYRAPDGTWLSAGTFGDKAVAKVSAKSAWDKTRQVDWIDPKGAKTLLARYAEDIWFPSLTLEVKTIQGYRSHYNRYVRPVFGSREMGSILYTEVKTWVSKMDDQSIGRPTQRQAFTVMRLILKSAFHDRLIPAMATAGVQTRPVPRPEVKIFTPQQFEAFMQHVTARWKPLLEVGMATGMRASELRALAPEQINWARKEIIIDRATVEVGSVDWGGRFVDKPYPKGKRSRRIRVSDDVLRILAQVMKTKNLVPHSTERIFGAFGANALSHVFRDACAKAEIPHRTMKHLRSSKASWMLKATNGDLAAVREYLGHSNVATTEKYLTVVEDIHDDDSNVISFEDYLKEAQ